METNGTTAQLLEEPVTGSGRDTEAAPAASARDLFRRRPAAARRAPARAEAARRQRILLASTSALAAAGLAGTVGFGLAWHGAQSQDAGAADARQAASRFLLALTNFNAKTVDRDFATVTAFATGSFAKQANTFFGSQIRQQLETAQASSQGQIRSMYVQTYSAGHASVYAVVDQTYANNKVRTPQSDVLRVVVDLSRPAGDWKVSELTVLEGPTSSGTGAAGGGG